MNKKYLVFLNKVSDKITYFCGDIRFVFLHLIWWGSWLLFGVEKFPFGLLTLIVSLESIVLSTFILMSQNRAEERDRRTANIDLKLDVETNRMVKQLLYMNDETYQTVLNLHYDWQIPGQCAECNQPYPCRTGVLLHGLGDK